MELVLIGDSALLSDVQLELEQILQTLPVDLLRLRRQRPVDAATMTDSGLSLQELTPADVFAARLAQEELSADLQTRLQQLHQQALQLLQAEPEVATAGEAS
jgi:exonuclease SbcD